MPDTPWHLRVADEDSGELEALLAAGWEPFAATVETRSNPRKQEEWTVTVYHLRKRENPDG